MKLLPKAWLIGLVITLITIFLDSVVRTPLAFLGTILFIPLRPFFIVSSEIAQRMKFSEVAIAIVSFVSLVFGGSVIYGALAFVVLRLPDRPKSR